MWNWTYGHLRRLASKRKWILAPLAFMPVFADLAASTTLRPGFWSQFLPNLYYASIVIAGLEFGWKTGLGFALFAGMCHAIIGRLLLASPFLRLEAQFVAFLVVGFAFLEERKRTSRRAKEASAPAARGAHTDAWLEHVSRTLQELLRETRTPFTSIEGAAHLLEDDSVSPGKRKEFAGMIVKECNRVHNMLAELSESAIVAPLSCEPTDASTLLEEIARLAALERPDPAISLSIEVAPDLPRLWCDRGRIERTILPFVTGTMAGMLDGGKILLAADRQDNHARIQLRILGQNVRGGDPALGRGPYSSTFDAPGGMQVLEARRTVLQHRGIIELDRTGYQNRLLFLTLPLYNGRTG